MKTLIPLAALLLAACASTPAPPAAKPASVKPAAKSTAKPAAVAGAPAGTTLVCRDERSTGSNIKRRSCEYLTEAQIQARKDAVEALSRRRQPGSSNSDP